VVSQALPVGTFDLVIFGGTGDLARRKLLPALLQRFADGQIEAHSRIIAIARDALSAEEYRNHIRADLVSSRDGSTQAGNVMDDFLAHVDYRAIDATRDAGWSELREMLDTGPSSDPGSIIPVARSGDLPLSFAQQRLWILDRLLPDKAVYNIPSLWRLHGKLDVEALRRSIQTLVERHETLRTRFVLNAEGPMQVVGPAHPVTLPITDLGALPQAERALRARELFEKEADRAFDLKAGPVLRTQLLRIEVGRGGESQRIHSQHLSA